MVIDQSAFLQSLGYALANSLWQMAALWLAVTVISPLFRLSATARFRLSAVAQIVGLIGFVFTGLNHLTIIGTQEVISTGSTAIMLFNPNALLPYLSLVYLPLLAWLSLRWFIGYRKTQSLRLEGLQKMPVEWRLFTQQAAGKLGIQKEVRIFLSEKIITPLTIGFIKPVILVPVASMNHLSQSQMEAVLLHELAHIRRYDYLVNILSSLAELVLFFNPFARLLTKNMERERENACDDLVMQFKYDPADYSAALLRIASLPAVPVFALAAAFGKKKELLARIQRINGTKQARRSYKQNLPSFLLLTGAMALATGFFQLSGNHSSAPQIYQPMISSVDKPVTPQASFAKYIEPLQSQKPLAVMHVKQLAVVKKQATAKEAITKKPVHINKGLKLLTAAVPAPSSVLLPQVIINNTTTANIAEPAAYNYGMNDLLEGLKNIDLENLVNRTLAYMQLTDEEKKQLGSINDLLVSDKDRELLRSDLANKSMHSMPVMINISFPLGNATSDEDVQRLMKIKLAYLKKLNRVMQNRVKNIPDLSDVIIIGEQ